MGAKQSTNNSPSRLVTSVAAAGGVGGSTASDDNSATSTINSAFSTPYRSGLGGVGGPRSSTTNESDYHKITTNRDWRQRARSLTAAGSDTSGGTRPSTHSSAIDFSLTTSSQDILDEDNESFTHHSSLPLRTPFQFQPYSFNAEIEKLNQLGFDCHLLCSTLMYNEDILTEDKGECVICLEEMLKGDKIARLECLCIYHKTCIDAWFDVKRSCPEHPVD